MPDSTLPLRKAKAAALIAEGRTTHEAIAKLCGVNARTLSRWRLEAAFQIAVEEHLKRLRRLVTNDLIGSKQQRLSALGESLQALNEIRAARGKDQDLMGAPGGTTGLVTRRLKVLRTDKECWETVEEFKVDYGWIDRQRAILQQAAIELGQWVEKHETGFRRLKDLTEEELALLIADGVEEFGQEAVDAGDTD